MLSGEFVDLLKIMMRQPSVVGAEHAFFRVLQRELEERGANVTWYEGLLVARGRQPLSTMFSAHIDRHGLICTGPGEFQYAAFISSNRSDLLKNSVSEEMMRKVAGRFTSVPVFAYEPWSGAYGGSGIIKDSYVCDKRKNLIFELEGLGDVVAGTPVAFEDRLKIFDGRLQGQLDNVLTTAAIVQLFGEGFEGTAFFTAEEEAGKSWRYLLEWFCRFGRKTNRLFVLDTSPFATVEEADQWQIVLREKDANADFDKATSQIVEKMCLTDGISYVYKDRYIEASNKQLLADNKSPHSLGSTELGRIIAASEGLVTGTTIQIPTYGYHTMEESAAQGSVAAFMRLLRTLSA